MIIPPGYEMVEDAINAIGKEKYRGLWGDREYKLLQRARVIANGASYHDYPIVDRTDEHTFASLRIFHSITDLTIMLFEGRKKALWVDHSDGSNIVLNKDYWLRDIWKALEGGWIPHPSSGLLGRVYVSKGTYTVASSKNKGGRPTKDWIPFMLEVVRIANTPDGLPEKQADLERVMLKWCEATWGGAGETTVRDMVRDVYRSINQGAKT